MFATLKYNPSFSSLLVLTLSLLDHAYAQRYFIGDRCSTPRGPGACQLIHQCSSVYNDLKSAKWPEVNCGFQGNTPIVCCPTANAPPPRASTVGPVWDTSRQTVTNRPVNPSVGGKISAQVCAEYEQLFFGKVTADTRDQNKRRVTEGENATALEFPHMVAVGYNKGSSISWDCGGTLISDRFVVTAAHCLNSPQRGPAQWVRLGALVLSASNDNSQVLRIVEKIRHPEYRPSDKYNDIALLKLERSVTFNSKVRPACLDTREIQPGKRTLATGWGLTDFNDDNSRSTNLLKVDVPIVAYSNCASFYINAAGLPRGIDDRRQICAGENGKDTCQGDSGGPLIIKGRILTIPRLVGVTSFGSVCGSVAPGVYTRVSIYVPWIESIVWAR